MTLAATDSPLIASHDAVLLDLDGVVYRGGDAVPGAVEALTSVEGARLAYLTNNANRPPSAVADHLRDLGLTVTVDDIVTSAQAIAGVMAHDLPAGATVFAIGGEGLRTALKERGLVPVDDRHAPEVAAVVQGYAPQLGWRDLAEAAYAIETGLPWYASNTDLTIPTAEGIAPGNGALVHAVGLAVGREPVVAGKPYAPLFEETIARISPGAPLMVGDRLDTDISGARRASIPSLFVLTGVSSLADVVNAAEDELPDYVGLDLSALHDAHPEVVVEGDRATCGSASAEIADGVLRVATSGGPTETLRAVVALGWAARAESGITVTVDATIGA
ncbi:HAD-IIA family hydrolase [Aeromicrobium senzhongii]|uniref:HAD-IIA family hydrolase n=1 Tax=Aeromicrobium senzhongii TaxID=2663859 RepID=A0ABX6SRP5_9ACTN|nr:HAD-IIA family hydrolase [Aeromicrobium senzhongii]MTB86735.1 HAD-IIA family hydrolase [Aeromicrobium senzhongii]QNL93415.1 HAD-IIA family hydrolase [Aeromicrobium senzhongii]